MLCHVGTDVSEEHSSSINRVTRISELGTLALAGNRSTLRRSTIVYVVFLRRVLWLLVNTNVVPTSPILVTLILEALRSSETSILTRATRRYIPENGILHSDSRDNLKSYIALTAWAL
jgi:hypothetical protein